MKRRLLAVLVGLFLLTPFAAQAKSKKVKEAPTPTPPEAQIAPELYQGLAWRNIGPFRGGRATAVAGVAGEPMTYYFGATGGGVWKTTDGGTTWANITDGFVQTGSVGAIAVAPSDPNVIYLGMGEAPIRGVASSHGDGVYRSNDAGKTWQRLGLAATRQISRIHVHPQNPELVYVAAQGSPWQANPERGIYRSSDGGKTWQLVHHVSNDAGASDLDLDPTNPRILFAGYWDHRRTPWQVRSGGPGSGVFRSKDGGDTWEKLTSGLPELAGKVGVAISASKPERVWALIEAEEGGLFRSDDGGGSWQKVNSDRVLRARAWYYTHVTADPVDADTVYVLNAPMLRSVDGGRTFQPVRTPHGDNHALWINPTNNAWMINANDGGANVSFNRGATWSTQGNQPTAQFYRVNVDHLFPYSVYGGQQDNSTVAIKSAGEDGSIGVEDWRDVGGCESAHVAFDRKQPAHIYAGCYQGQISEYEPATGRLRDVMAYPVLGLASIPRESKYRFNWNAPIVVSQHDPSVIYHGAQKLLRSRDRGHSWEEVSPELTGNDPAKQGPGGAPITSEGAGGEIYQTIFYVAESPHAAGTLWVGTDDGHVHLTRDGGVHWREVTPPGLGEAQVNAIEVSPHDPATAWLAVTRYKFGDFTPHIFETADFGATWQRRVSGIGAEAFVRVVREDPVRRGLLYAGTETGIYVSFNSGASWQGLQLNLPVVPVTDLIVHGDDLVASTQGRAFWILDNLTPLRQLRGGEGAAAAHLFKPAVALAVDLGGGFMGPPPGSGENPPGGATIDYLLAEDHDPATSEVKLEILDSAGMVLRTLSSKPKDEGRSLFGPGLGPPPPRTLPAKKGMNRASWDLRREAVTKVEGLFQFNARRGPRVAPGTYQVRLTVGDSKLVQPLEVRPDPRQQTVSEAAAAEHARVLATLADALDALYRTVNQLREVKGQVEGWVARAKGRPGADEVEAAGGALTKDLAALEDELVQTKSENFQDIINFPNRLDAELGSLLDTVDASGPPVSAGVKARWADLALPWSETKARAEELLSTRVAAFSELIAKHAVPAIVVGTGEPKPAAPRGAGRRGGEEP